MKHFTTCIICFLVLLLLTACSNNDRDILGSGSFEATELLVSSEVSGKVLEWKAEEGMLLKRGEVIGLVDTTQLFLQREALIRSGKSVYAGRPDIQTQTAILEIQLEDLKKQKKRIEKLLGAGAASQKELDDLETGISSIQSKLEAARSSLTKSSAQITAQSSSIDIQIAQVDDMIRRSIIISPIDGTVVASYVRAGELTGSGRPLFRVADLSHMYLRAYIPAGKLSRLKVGDVVKVLVDDSDQNTKQYDGRITWISARSEFTPKNVQTQDERSNLVFAVKVLVENDGYIRIGMYGEVVES